MRSLAGPLFVIAAAITWLGAGAFLTGVGQNNGAISSYAYDFSRMGVGAACILLIIGLVVSCSNRGRD